MSGVEIRVRFFAEDRVTLLQQIVEWPADTADVVSRVVGMIMEMSDPDAVWHGIVEVTDQRLYDPTSGPTTCTAKNDYAWTRNDKSLQYIYITKASTGMPALREDVRRDFRPMWKAFATLVKVPEKMPWWFRCLCPEM